MRTHNKKRFRIIRNVIIMLLMIAHVAPLRAYFSNVRNLDNGSGLLDGHVTCFAKDSKGFMWFGTNNTIQRFDGVQFKCFNFPEKVERVNVIVELDDYNFLVGTNKGLWNFDSKSGALVQKFAEISFPVNALCRVDDKVYVGTTNGIYTISEEQKIEHVYVASGTSAYNHIIGALPVAKNIWFLTPEGVVSFNISTEGIHVYNKDEKFTSKFSCMAGDDNLLYIGTAGDGIVTFDMLMGEYSSFPFEVGNNSIADLSLQKDVLCCGTSGSGVYFISLADKRIIHSISTMPNADGERLSSDMIACLFMDEMNVLWIADARHRGVDYLQFRNKAFRPYGTEYLTQANKAFDCLYIADDIKLLGTPYGFYYICDTQSLVRYFPSFSEEMNMGSPAVFMEYDGDILIGTRGKGAYKLNRQTLQVSRFLEEDLIVKAFAKDKSGYIWISTSCGIHCYDSSLKPVKVYTCLNSTLVDDNVNYLYIDSKERYWVATNKGLQFFDTKDEVFSEISSSAELQELLPVTYMTENSQGNFLFCFNQNRMFVCDSAFSQSRYVCTPDDAGYLGYNIRKVLQDKNGNYWLVGSRGVVRGDSTLCHFTLFSSTEGLPEPYSYDGQLLDETIWLATSKGIVFADINSEPQSVPTVITDFLVNGVTALNDYLPQIEGGDIVALSEDQNTLDITFSTLTYDNPTLMIYEYQLVGYDKEWKILRGINTVKYTDLPAGEYTFKVRKQMDDSSMQSIRIKIGSSSSAWLWIILGAVLLVTVIFIVMRSWSGKRQTQTNPIHNSHNSEEKYRYNKKISEEEARNIIGKLKEYMEQERAFLNPELKLTNMAEAVGVSTQTLSQIFNVNLQTNYYDFINKYRIEEFKRLVRFNEKERYTLNALAALCGFSSYTTFFRAFKETTGITPNKYIRQDRQTD